MATSPPLQFPHNALQLTFVTDPGQAFLVEIDADMEFEIMMVLLEAEVRPAPRRLPG